MTVNKNALRCRANIASGSATESTSEIEQQNIIKEQSVTLYIPLKERISSFFQLCNSYNRYLCVIEQVFFFAWIPCHRVRVWNEIQVRINRSPGEVEALNSIFRKDNYLCSLIANKNKIKTAFSQN